MIGLAARMGAAGSGGPKTPADVAGLVEWWKADSLALADGAAIASWPGQMGAYTLTQATGGNRPIFKTGIVGGMPVARFGATGSMSVASFNLSATDKLTVFAVFSAPTGTRVVAEHSADFNGTSGAWLLYATGGGAVTFNPRGATGTPTVYSAFTTTGTALVAKAFVGTSDRSLSSNEVNGWLNGDPSGTHPTNSDTTGNNANATLYVGARAASSLYFTGDLAEIGIYNTALDAAGRAIVHNYLAAKYGLTITP